MIPDVLNIEKGDFSAIIVIIELVIQFCNAFMELCCDPCYPQVSIFSTLEMMVIIFFHNISRIVQWILK